MHQAAGGDGQSRALADVELERSIEKIFFLHLGATLDLDESPGVGTIGNENVDAGISASGNKGGLVERKAVCEGLPGLVHDLLPGDDVWPHLDPPGVTQFRQLPDRMALVEDGLRGGIYPG